MYTVKNGTVSGAIELYFSEKPGTETRGALKEMRFRWNGKKSCWYGFKTADEVAAAIGKAESTEEIARKPEFDEDAFNNEFLVKATDGYLGAIETTGSKSGFLFGSDLSKAIRTDLKKWNIKGVSVSVKTYSGGQHLYLTITPNAGDFKSLEEYKKLFYYEDGMPNYSELEGMVHWSWIGYREDGKGKSIHAEHFNAMEDGEEKKSIFDSAIEYYYNEETSGNVNERFYNQYRAFTEQFITRFSRIKQVVDSYNHDDSNSMVDCFDRDFYESYTIKTA